MNKLFLAAVLGIRYRGNIGIAVLGIEENGEQSTILSKDANCLVEKAGL